MPLAFARSHALPILAVSVSLLSVLMVIPIPADLSTPAERALYDALHFPAFVVLLVLVYATLLRIRPDARGRALLTSIFLASALGGAGECLQAFSSRTPSWSDFQTDLLGIAAGTSIVIGTWLKDSRCFPLWLVLLTAAGAGAAFLATQAAVHACLAERHQAAALPLLGDFENTWESLVWIPQGDDGTQATQATLSGSHPTRGKQSLKIETSEAPWSGVRVQIVGVLLWSGSQSLRFDVFNPGDALDLGIRVDGAGGRRFSGQVHLTPGLNNCRVPPHALRNRSGNLSEAVPFPTDTIVFHLGESPPPRTLYLDNVRLE